MPRDTPKEKKNLILPDNIPTINDIYDSRNSRTFLAVGTNENNTDTLILAHTDLKHRKIVLISLPRDLYFRGLKINAYNSLYGIEQLMIELSDITGLKVGEYVMIDMYALIEVINILGGIDIYLEKALVYPT